MRYDMLSRMRKHKLPTTVAVLDGKLVAVQRAEDDLYYLAPLNWWRLRHAYFWIRYRLGFSVLLIKIDELNQQPASAWENGADDDLSGKPEPNS